MPARVFRFQEIQQMNETKQAREPSPQASTPTMPISPHLAAVWGAFLHEGLMLNNNRSSRLLEVWGNGCIELISTLCDFIPDIWKQVQPYWYGPQGFPGVFEYEVVSILGEQLGTYLLDNDGNLPSNADIQQMITELVVTFFSQGGSHEIPTDQTPQTHRLINLHDRFTERLTQLEGGHS
jgi:hypothetical protein